MGVLPQDYSRVGEAAAALTPHGVDHVIEVGGPHTMGQSFAAVRSGEALFDPKGLRMRA